jgi:hypothetical protein
MTLRTSINARRLRDLYGELEDLSEAAPGQKVKQAVDDAYAAISDAFAIHGFATPNDDRAEEMIGLLYGFWMEGENPEALEVADATLDKAEKASDLDAELEAELDIEMPKPTEAQTPSSKKNPDPFA